MGNRIATMCIKLYKMLDFGLKFKKQAFCVHVTLKGLVKPDLAVFDQSLSLAFCCSYVFPTIEYSRFQRILNCIKSLLKTSTLPSCACI